MGEVLKVEGLTTRIRVKNSIVHAVEGLSLHLSAGETLGLVGESGSGKSTAGLSILGLLPRGGAVTSGSVHLNDRELVGISEREYQKIRGNNIAMVFQDSLSGLDPTKTIGDQVAEPFRVHMGGSRRESFNRALEMLSAVGIPDPRERMKSYPFQLSGGLRQRVMIAIALVCNPQVLIADEPTTALDVTTQDQILHLLDDLKKRLGMAIILITHDMGVIAEWTNRVDVMYAGRIVEETNTAELFSAMRHPYTQALLASIPTIRHDRNTKLYSIKGFPPDLSNLPKGCPFAERCAFATERCHIEEPALSIDNSGHKYACWHPVHGPLSVHMQNIDQEKSTEQTKENSIFSVESVVKEYSTGKIVKSSTVKAVSGISLKVKVGETLGLVGESGCGKSTFARMLVGLERPTSGHIFFKNEDITHLTKRALKTYNGKVQLIFQDPFESLDPRMTIEEILCEPLRIQGIGSHREQLEKVSESLAEVGLSNGMLGRYPHEFSGGQRQRIGIARALMLRPDVIVADEPVSALDVSIRSQILNLLKDLQKRHGLTCVVISHDLTVVKYLSDRIGVMYLGKLVEIGGGSDIFEHPIHPYTRALIDAIPIPEPGIKRWRKTAINGELPSAVTPPSGCRFRTRCPFAENRCAIEEPKLQEFEPGHFAACHFPLWEKKARRT